MTTHPVPQTAPAVAAPEQRLADKINAYIDQPRFDGAQWGISVVNLGHATSVYAHHGDKLFIPASNAKLYTAALALSDLGRRHRFRTSLYATARPKASGVLHGDLVLYGRGDPTLGRGTDTQTPTAWADQLAKALRARGVRRIRGNLIADATDYAGPPMGNGWEGRDLQSVFAAPPSALSVQRNAFGLSVGGHGTCCKVDIDPAAAQVKVVNLLHKRQSGEHDPLGMYRAPGSNTLYVFGSRPITSSPRHFQLAVPDPALMAGGLLVDALARHHIDFKGAVVSRNWPEAGMLSTHSSLVHISDVRSAPLGHLIEHMLKHSDNLYAQLLLLAAGKQAQNKGHCSDRSHAPTLTAAWGLCAMRAFERRVGLDDYGVQFEEGSGLSRKDLVAPAATTRLLGWINKQRFARVFKHALPIAGIDGTLHYRLRGASTKGNLRAKTGTLRYAYALSGYVTAANGSRLAFSIMLNSYARPTNAMGRPLGLRASHELDAVARMIADYGKVPEPTTPVSRQSPDAAAAPGTR